MDLLLVTPQGCGGPVSHRVLWCGVIDRLPPRWPLSRPIHVHGLVALQGGSKHPHLGPGQAATGAR